MANLCFCRLSVEGDDAALAAFLDAARDGDDALSFERLLPVPDAHAVSGEMAADEDPHLMDAALDWCRSNWGTERREGPADLEERAAGLARIELATAWSPPVALVEHLIDAYPAFRFELVWAEPHEELAGRLIGGHGVAVSVETPRSGDEDVWLRAVGWDFDWHGPDDELADEDLV
jgi:hypothetical protein